MADILRSSIYCARREVRAALSTLSLSANSSEVEVGAAASWPDRAASAGEAWEGAEGAAREPSNASEVLAALPGS